MCAQQWIYAYGHGRPLLSPPLAESRGDEFDAWGHSVWYFEVDNDGRPVRQIEVYDTGPVLRYRPGHEEDQYGALGQAT